MLPVVFLLVPPVALSVQAEVFAVSYIRGGESGFMEVILWLKSEIDARSSFRSFRSEYESQKARQCQHLQGDKGGFGLN